MDVLAQLSGIAAPSGDPATLHQSAADLGNIADRYDQIAEGLLVASGQARAAGVPDVRMVAMASSISGMSTHISTLVRLLRRASRVIRTFAGRLQVAHDGWAQTQALIASCGSCTTGDYANHARHGHADLTTTAVAQARAIEAQLLTDTAQFETSMLEISEELHRASAGSVQLAEELNAATDGIGQLTTEIRQLNVMLGLLGGGPDGGANPLLN